MKKDKTLILVEKQHTRVLADLNAGCKSPRLEYVLLWCKAYINAKTNLN